MFFTDFWVLTENLSCFTLFRPIEASCVSHKMFWTKNTWSRFLEGVATTFFPLQRIRCLSSLVPSANLGCCCLRGRCCWRPWTQNSGYWRNTIYYLEQQSSKSSVRIFCFVDWAGFSKTLRSVQITFEQKRKSMTANLKHLSLLTLTEAALKQSHVRQLFQRWKKKLRPPIGFLLQKFTFSRSQ